MSNSSFLTLAKNRYTTKKYNPSKKISEDKIQELKEILNLCPSSINSQPWKFSFISDVELKNKLASASYFNEQAVRDASHLVVFDVISDIEKFEKQIRENLQQRAVDYYMQIVKPRPEEVIKSWLERQVYLALGFFLSACASMEIDSTPMEGINCKEYEAILQPDGYKTLFAVLIGYRDPEDTNQPTITPKSRLPLESVIKDNNKQ